MKPRTKLQHEVMYLQKYMHRIRLSEKDWSYRECLEHKGFATKNRVICMDCGQTFGPELVKRKRAICPHCATKLKIEYTQKRTDKQRSYFAIAEIHAGFQVIRNFELIGNYKAGKKASLICCEILQHWIADNGKREVVACNHCVNWYCDAWNGCLEIRNKKDTRRYDVYPLKIHPNSKFKAEYLKYGINHKLQGLTPLGAIQIIPNQPRAETLLKAKQYSLLSSFANGYPHNVNNYWSSIKICMRNKYIVKDAGIWSDYINLLRYFNKDIRNAHYVCPRNLKKVHDHYVAKKRKVQEQQERERKRVELLKNEAAYREFIQRFMNIVFKDKGIEIRPLQTVEEFMHEGDALHHCVFTNEYFKNENCLILSARLNGERLETIEFSLEKMKVVQSRGKFNEDTEHHDRIVKLVNRNKKKIKQMAEAV